MGAAFRKQAKKEYTYDRERVLCQITGLWVSIEIFDHLDVCHIKPSGMGGAKSRDTFENVICGLGHRWKPNNPHKWMDARKSRQVIAQKQKVNILNREIIQWPPQEKESLKIFMQTGYDPINLKKGHSYEK